MAIIFDLENFAIIVHRGLALAFVDRQSLHWVLINTYTYNNFAYSTHVWKVFLYKQTP